jgi:hypothetical protein
MLATVLSGDVKPIYVDRTGLFTIPQLFNDFKIYEKWFVHKVSLEFVPNQPVTVGGSMTMAPDYDPLDPFPVSLASLSASFNFTRKPITNKSVCNMPNFKLPDGSYMRPALYTGPVDVDRNVSYGKFVYSALSSLSDGVEVGSMILHWDISFMVKQPLSTSTGTTSTDKAIKITYDTAGTIVTSPIYNATALDEVTMFAADKTTPAPLANSRIYSGIITALTDCTLNTIAGQAVTAGTRIFFQMSQLQNNGTTVYPIGGATVTLGRIALSRTLDKMMDILITRAGDAWIEMTGIKYFD